ncbi:hypothetical protein FKM82_031129 [Ascaphus truei]
MPFVGQLYTAQHMAAILVFLSALQHGAEQTWMAPSAPGAEPDCRDLPPQVTWPPLASFSRLRAPLPPPCKELCPTMQNDTGAGVRGGGRPQRTRGDSNCPLRGCGH